MDLKYAKKLYLCRTYRGITQKKLSEITGVSKNSIGAYENGKNMPPTDVYERLLRGMGFELNVKEDELWQL